MMTNQERAEKIADEYCLSEFTREKYIEFVGVLTTEFDAAVADAVREATNSICDEEGHTLPCGCHCHRKLLIACNKAWFEGCASAIEAAAKVADEQSDDLETDMSWKYCAEKIAKSIRALRPTSEEGK